MRLIRQGMIGEQTRRKILNRYDKNGNGVIDRVEVAKPCPVLISPTLGAPPLDYGALSPGPEGVPRLNPIFCVWYLDGAGSVLPGAYGLDAPRVAAFDFAMRVFGWGRGYRVSADGRHICQGGEASTLREIYTLAADVHLGLQAHDPTQQQVAGGVAGSSNRSSLSAI